MGICERDYMRRSESGTTYEGPCGKMNMHRDIKPRKKSYSSVYSSSSFALGTCRTVYGYALTVLLGLLKMYASLVFLRCILSWAFLSEVEFFHSPLVYRIHEFLVLISEPALVPLRECLPHYGIIVSNDGLAFYDLSPIALWVITYFVALLVGHHRNRVLP